jgi:tetrahydromethanopterin S-methyltransferase subunit G
MIRYLFCATIIFALNVLYAQDTLQIKDTTEKKDYLLLTKSPTGAVLRSLALPGWGQIYVEQYCKVPVFVGGAGFLWYRIISNHIDYIDYKKQLDKIENKTSFEYQVLKSRTENAVDNRDLSVLYLLGVYVLSMVDAYSGAHLFDFNINSNLSYSIFPTFDFAGNPYIKIGFVYRLDGNIRKFF